MPHASNPAHPCILGPRGSARWRAGAQAVVQRRPRQHRGHFGSDPRDPEILGKLKIPGYSDYLHHYDENHIIGFGKDTIEAAEDEVEMRGFGFAWYQGMKVAMFDVTDVANPVELHKMVIGDRGTDSPLLYNHKALLFDKEMLRKITTLRRMLGLLNDEEQLTAMIEKLSKTKDNKEFLTTLNAAS